MKADKTKDWKGLSWEKLGQNPTMQALWTQLGYTKEIAADIIMQVRGPVWGFFAPKVAFLAVLCSFFKILFFSAKRRENPATPRIWVSWGTGIRT